MPELKRSEVPALVRKLITQARKADEKNRQEMKADLMMRVGGEGQWDQQELRKRKEQNRPAISINKIAMPCNHIENEIRSNPPGPVCHPIGDGDSDTADVIEGLIREIEYRCKAPVTYETMGGQVAAGGLAAVQLVTEYVDPSKNDDQQICIELVEDPSTVYWDPNSRKFDRSDAMWAARVRQLGKEVFEQKYGKKAVENLSNEKGWAQTVGYLAGDRPVISEWTSGGRGPFWVVEFYWVQQDTVKMAMYSNHLAYEVGSDDIPKGVKPKDGRTWEYIKKTVMMYVVSAVEVLEDPCEWLGTRPPLFPALGQEIWIEGECKRLSLVRDSRGSQKGLNYAASEMLFLAGTLTKTPWTGPRGVFGNGDKWDTANQEPWAFIEWDPQFYPDTNGQMHMGPGPERVERVAEVDSSLKMCAFFSDSIQTATGMLDPSRQLASSDNPAKKVEQLQAQGQLGSIQYQGNVLRAIECMYEEIMVILPQIMDAPRALTIVKPDTQTEKVLINQEFQQGEKKVHHDIKGALGKYSVRCMAGPSYPTRRDEATQQLTEFFKVAPQALTNPKMMAQFLRLVAEGNPIVRQMADILDPPMDGNITPDILQGQLSQSQQQVQALQKIVQALSMKLQAGLPKIEADKWKAALEHLDKEQDRATRIAIAEISASKDQDKATADAVLQIMNLAHERGMQAADQIHEMQMSQMPQPVDPNAPSTSGTNQ
jgi:Phage P22-like portal protein